MSVGFPSEEQYQRAVDTLSKGGIVSFPTETYYGLGVDIDSKAGIEALFRLKERDQTKPILVLICDLLQLDEVAAHVPDIYRVLMRRFWPGPLTLIFPARMDRMELLTGGTGTIGVRMSPHPVAQELCRRWGKPVTATSANISGTEPPQLADRVREMFGTKIDYILDGGKTPGGGGSTVVGLTNGELVLYRAGPIAFSQIVLASRAGLGQVGSV